MSEPVDIEQLAKDLDHLAETENDGKPWHARPILRIAARELESLRLGAFTSAGLIRGYTAENERLRARIVELEREPTEAEVDTCHAELDNFYGKSDEHGEAVIQVLRAFVAGRVGDDGGGRPYATGAEKSTNPTSRKSSRRID